MKKILTSRTAKDNGVKRQLLVAVAENLSENYENVKQVFFLIQLNKLDFITSCNLKLANILTGLQSHSSSPPCTWYDVDSLNLAKAGILRTLGSIRCLYREFKASGGNIRKAKVFKNVVHEPLIPAPDSKLILEVIPPMELHLLPEVLNHLFPAHLDHL